MKQPSPGERSNGQSYSPSQAFVPHEIRGLFRTHDGRVYRRTPNAFIDVKGEQVQFGGTIRRVIPKVRGKKARRADKAARRKAALA